MKKQRDGSLEKSARLIILMRWQDSGKLNGLSLSRISNLFPSKPARTTIMRDLRDVTRLRKTIKDMEA